MREENPPINIEALFSACLNSQQNIIIAEFY